MKPTGVRNELNELKTGKPLREEEIVGGSSVYQNGRGEW